MKYFKLTVIILFLFGINSSNASDEKLQIKITKNLRCLICQGQSVYDSDSEFANSLKVFVKNELNNGKTEIQIYDDLKTITTRFNKHFDNIYALRKKLEEAMTVVDSFGKDARSITRTLENIKDPEQVEIAAKTENVEKFVERSKQVKN